MRRDEELVVHLLCVAILTRYPLVNNKTLVKLLGARLDVMGFAVSEQELGRWAKYQKEHRGGVIVSVKGHGGCKLEDMNRMMAPLAEYAYKLTDGDEEFWRSVGLKR